MVPAPGQGLRRIFRSATAPVCSHAVPLAPASADEIDAGKARVQTTSWIGPPAGLALAVGPNGSVPSERRLPDSYVLALVSPRGRIPAGPSAAPAFHKNDSDRAAHLQKDPTVGLRVCQVLRSAEEQQ